MVFNNDMVEQRIVFRKMHLIIAVAGIMRELRRIDIFTYCESMVLIPLADSSSIVFQFIFKLIYGVYDSIYRIISIFVFIVSIFREIAKCAVCFTVAVVYRNSARILHIDPVRCVGISPYRTAFVHLNFLKRHCSAPGIAVTKLRPAFVHGDVYRFNLFIDVIDVERQEVVVQIITIISIGAQHLGNAGGSVRMMYLSLVAIGTPGVFRLHPAGNVLIRLAVGAGQVLFDLARVLLDVNQAGLNVVVVNGANTAGSDGKVLVVKLHVATTQA